MKCKKCGAELKEGNLYCEQCGEEIKIVPEFDPEFESQINQTIVHIAQEAFEEQNSMEGSAKQNMDTLEFRALDDDLPEDFRDILPKNNRKIMHRSRKKIVIILVSVFAFFFMVIVLISAVNHSNATSYESQYRSAVNSAANGNYDEAITFMEKALALNPENEDAQFLLAGYYRQAGNERSAIILLQELIRRNTFNNDDVYDMLISIYIESQNYQEIADLLDQCKNEVILSKYHQYHAEAPDFSQAQGDYDKIISITLSGSTDGVIHYTLDGATPTKSSPVYDDTPILLDAGTHTIRAFFTNAYGIDSEIVVQTYHIIIQPPDAPQINIESGEYKEPRLIEVIYSPETKVYYTTDGTTPNANSYRYTEPLEMPVGISNFHFVAINEAGAVSEVEQRSFQLTLENYLTPELALQVLMNNLQVNGIILNPEGNVPNRLGHNTYVVHTAVVIEGNMYYIIVENYVDTTGSIHEAQSNYAIDAITGDPYYAWKIGEGKYTLREF